MEHGGVPQVFQIWVISNNAESESKYVQLVWPFSSAPGRADITAEVPSGEVSGAAPAAISSVAAAVSCFEGRESLILASLGRFRNATTAAWGIILYLGVQRALSVRAKNAT